MKICPRCKLREIDPKIRGYCRPCKALVRKDSDRKNAPLSKEARRKYRLMSKYSLRIEDYNIILYSQQFCCAACDARLNLGDPHQYHLDHCHRSGKVRGILCGGCNRALGLMKDNADNLRKLADYVEKHR